MIRRYSYILFLWQLNMAAPHLRSSADSLYNLGEYSSALRLYEDMLEKDGQRHVWHRQALCYARMDYNRVAIRLYLNYLGHFPTDGDARLMLGHVYRWSGKHENAMHQYRTVLKIHPDYSEAALALAAMHLKAGEWKPAKAVLKKLKGKKPDAPGLRVLWDRLYRVSRPVISPEVRHNTETEWDESSKKFVVETSESAADIKLENPWHPEHRSKFLYESAYQEEKHLVSGRPNFAFLRKKAFFSHTIHPNSYLSVSGGCGPTVYENSGDSKFRLSARQSHLNLSASVRYAYNDNKLMAGFARGERIIKYDMYRLKILAIKESYLSYRRRLSEGISLGGTFRHVLYELGNERSDLEGWADYKPAFLKGASVHLIWQYTDFFKDVSYYYSYDFRNRIQGRLRWEQRVSREWKAYISLRGHWDGVVETLNPGVTFGQAGCDKRLGPSICLEDRMLIDILGYDARLGLSWMFRTRYGCHLIWNRYRNDRLYKAGGIRLHGTLIF